MPALILAFILRFLLEWTLALSAFWTTRTSSVNQLYFTIFLFFSGRLAPLSLFPPALVVVAIILPFRWTLFFPIELFLGNLTPLQALWGMAIQLGWILAALLHAARCLALGHSPLRSRRRLTMRAHFRLIATYMRLSVLNELQYRANFWGALLEASWGLPWRWVAWPLSSITPTTWPAGAPWTCSCLWAFTTL